MGLVKKLEKKLDKVEKGAKKLEKNLGKVEKGAEKISDLSDWITDFPSKLTEYLYSKIIKTFFKMCGRGIAKLFRRKKR